MIYITGDTHARFKLFMPQNFQADKLTKNDYVIICGDFGGIWSGSEYENMNLDYLESLPFTLLFITGNHDNYDLLESYPVSEWNGGKVQFIRPHVIHLMRGQVFTLEGKTFFTMGGAECHDIWNGVMDPDDPEFTAKCSYMDSRNMFYRVKGESWWSQEIPSETEYEEGLKNLREHGMKVDYVLSHCAPEKVQSRIVPFLGQGTYPSNSLTAYLQEVSEQVSFKRWYFGHYHKNVNLGKYFLIYDRILPL